MDYLVNLSVLTNDDNCDECADGSLDFQTTKEVHSTVLNSALRAASNAFLDSLRKAGVEITDMGYST